MEAPIQDHEIDLTLLNLTIQDIAVQASISVGQAWPTLQSAFSTNLVAGNCPGALPLGWLLLVSHRREKHSATGSSSCVHPSSRAPLSKAAWCLANEAHFEARPHSSRREDHRAWPFSHLPWLHPWKTCPSKQLCWRTPLAVATAHVCYCAFLLWSFVSCWHLQWAEPQQHQQRRQSRSRKHVSKDIDLQYEVSNTKACPTNNLFNGTNPIK